MRENKAEINSLEQTLVVSESFFITERGTAVFFREDPKPWYKYPGKLRVKITTSDGKEIETIAEIEFARKVPPGEVQSFLFRDLKKADIPEGSIINVLEQL